MHIDGLLGRELQGQGKGPGPNLLLADQAHARHSNTLDEFGAERLGQNLEVHAVFDQDAAVDDASQHGDSHRSTIRC